MILNNCEMWFIHCNPKRPNTMFDKENPSWDLQIRTKDPEQKNEWAANNVIAKLLVYPEGHEKEGEPVLDENGKKEWRFNLRKKIKKANGESATPVEFVDGNLREINPDSVGNGSLGNIRVFQYEYDKLGVKKHASILMSVQVTRHIIYKPAPREGFSEVETEVIIPENKGVPSVPTNNDEDF